MEDTRDPNILFYTPPDNPDDVPAAYFIPVGQGDGDEITALWAAKESLFVFKRRSIWVLEGYSHETFSIRQLTTGVGCDSQASISIVNVEGGEFAVFWCWPRVYIFDGFNQPIPVSLALDEELRTTERMPSYRSFAVNAREQHLCLIAVTPDDSVETERLYAYDYVLKSFMPLEGYRASSIGVYRNRYGNEFLFLTDEFGSVQQLFEGTAGDVAITGDTSGDIDTWNADTLTFTDTSATFTTTYNSIPVHLIDASGNYYENRGIVTTGTSVRLAWPPEDADGNELTPDNTWSYLLGGYRTFWETGEDAGIQEADITEREKSWQQVNVEHKKTSATVTLLAAADSDSLTSVESFSTNTDGPTRIGLRKYDATTPKDFRGTTLRLRFQIFAPGEVTIQGYRTKAKLLRERND
jgi:hypothetical protein